MLMYISAEGNRIWVSLFDDPWSTDQWCPSNLTARPCDRTDDHTYRIVFLRTQALRLFVHIYFTTTTLRTLVQVIDIYIYIYIYIYC